MTPYQLRLKIAEASIVLEHHFDPGKWTMAYTGRDSHGRQVSYSAKDHCLVTMAERIQVVQAGHQEVTYKAMVTLDFFPGEFTLTSHEPSESRALLSLWNRLSDTCDKLGVSDLIPSVS